MEKKTQVEPLQNGEREENSFVELRNRFVKFWTDLDSLGYAKIPLKDDDSRKLLDFIANEISQSKKEGYRENRIVVR